MKKSIILLLAASLALMFTGCSRNPDDGYGRLVVKITDAPFPIDKVESATVTITKVELRKAGDCVNDGNPFMVVWEGSRIFDLIDLRNGVAEKLVNLEIPSGEYDLIRLYVDEAGLKIKDGDTFTLKVPSGQQTGIKLFVEPGIVVEDGLTSELLLDFDLSDSFVIQGNMNSPAGVKGFIFKPVIRAVNISTSGTLEGLVTEVVGTENVRVGGVTIYIKQGDADVASAITDSAADNNIEDGYYAITGLLPGTYTVVASKEGYQTVTTENVTISAGSKTVLNFVLPK